MNQVFSCMFLSLAMYVLYTCGITFLTWQWWIIVTCFALHDVLWRD